MVVFGIFWGFAFGVVFSNWVRPYLLSWRAKGLEGLPDDVDPDIYEEVEIVKDATVQVLQNSRTGEYSFGWWRNE